MSFDDDTLVQLPSMQGVPPIEEDQSALGAEAEAISRLPAGSSFRKVDLHVHTPASADIGERSKRATPDDVVNAALAAGLDAIAITDHNGVDWCDAVREASQGTDLVVFPGAEISTSEGHLLAIFDPSKLASEIRDLLARVGIPGGAAGKLDKISTKRLDELAQEVENDDGVAIAAHVEAEKGFWRLTEPTGVRRQQIYACKSIRAFEIVHADLREPFVDGTIDGYERCVACVQGSDCWPAGGDAHEIDAIGNRFALLRVDELSVDGLRQALLDPALRVRLAGDSLPRPPMVLEGVGIRGGFLDEQRIRFNQGITCLIGGTGSGKSLTLELVRFALDQSVETGILDKIAAETGSLLAFGLGQSATVRVLVSKGTDHYLVERARIGGQELDPVVYRASDTGLEVVEDVYVPALFPIKAFSQGEIIEYAREPLARLSLVDDLIDIAAERNLISAVKGELRGNSTAIVEIRRRLAEAQARLKPLPGLEEQIEQLEKFVADPRIKAHDAWNDERESFDEALEDIDRFAADLEGKFPLPAEPDGPKHDDDASSPNPDLVDRLQATMVAFSAQARQSRQRLKARVAKSRKEVESILGEWDGRFKEADREYRALLAEMDKDGLGRKALSDRLGKLRRQRKQLLDVRDKVKKEDQPQLKTLEEQRDMLLSRLGELRTAVRDRRRAKANELSKRLAGRVRITVRGEADMRLHREALLELRQGSFIREADVTAMAKTLHPIPFVRSLLAGDYKALAELSGLDENVFGKLHSTIEERNLLPDLHELQIVDREDVVRIRFATEQGQYRDLEALAHGQKCTVVLMVSLAEGDTPLIVDQPEDALHAPWIEDHIVSTLRADRGRRQCIFATRSANVLVSSDAEQVVAMTSRADRGWVDQTGGLDKFDTRQLVLYHVEGGEEAFTRRQVKYALVDSSM